MEINLGPDSQTAGYTSPTRGIRASALRCVDSCAEAATEETPDSFPDAVSGRANFATAFSPTTWRSRADRVWIKETRPFPPVATKKPR
jgi:hypothetical protein